MPRTGWQRRASARGFTLVELLVVLAIVAVLLSLTVAVLRRVGQSSTLDATAHAVRALLRRARNSALEERYPCVVHLDVESGTLGAQLKTSITRFRFEGAAVAGETGAADDQSASLSDEDPTFELEGSRGVRLTVERGAAFAGRFGQGLGFSRDDPEESCWAWIEHRPVLNPQEGVYISCWLRLGDLDETLHERKPRYSPVKEQEAFARSGDPAVKYADRVFEFSDRDPPRYTIVRKGRSYALAVTANYELELTLEGEDGVYQTRTRPGTLRPLAWYEVTAIYDGLRVQLLVNGIPRHHLPLRGKGELPPRLIADRSPLSVSDSHPRRAFFGVLDELELGALVRSERVELPPDIELAASTERVVFDFMGELDAGVHAEPVAIYLCDVLPTPEGGGAAPTGTRTRAEDEARRMAAGGDAYARFRKRLPEIPERNLETVLIERTGLVR
ncbi:MAG: prepilin-type N-terminal cleavage/methylation domain-containing protein [Planctomycetota bacterium]